MVELAQDVVKNCLTIAIIRADVVMILIVRYH